MADVITRFKLETTQFDSKLREASKSLADLTHHYSMAGKDFDKFSKNSVESARALGTVASGATNAKDKVKDLVGAFNSVAKAYNTLSQEQKQTDYGKALAESLQTLKGRVTEAKQELYSMADSGKSTGGIMGALADKFTVSFDAVKLFNTGLQAAQSALGVVKDAFFSSETNVDEWGRTVASAESIYNAFVISLNNSDFSGFLARIGEIVGAAKDAYNAMDELNTRMTIINPERVKLQTVATQLKATIRREGADSEAGRKAQAQLKGLEPVLAQSYKTESQLNWNAFESEVNKRLREAGITLGEESKKLLMESFHSDSAYMSLKRGARGQASRMETVETQFGRGVRETADTRNINQKLLDLFTDEWRKQYAPYLSASFSALSSSASVMLSDARYVKESKGGGSGGGGGKNTPKPEEILPTGSIADLTKQMQELRKEQSLVTNPDGWKAYQEQIREVNVRIKVLKGEMAAIGAGGLAKATGTTTVSKEVFGAASSWVDKRKEQLEKGQIDFKPVNSKIDAITKGGKDAEEAWRAASQAITSVGSALASIENPAVKIVGTIGLAIANIAAGFAEASSKEGKGGIWYWIAATASGLATMISTIATIHSATGFAEGGIVGGNSYSGDNVNALGPGGSLIGLNSGELILNKSQQNTVAALLQSNGVGNLHLETTLRGEDIRIVLRRNSMRRSGGYEKITY